MTNTNQTIARLQKEIRSNKAILRNLEGEQAHELHAEIESLEWTLQSKIEIQQMEEQAKNGNGLFD